MKLEPCPCCLGKAEVSDMKVAGTRMWQVHCTVCGLASELDDDRGFSIQRWNKRLEKARLKTWVTFLAGVLPFLVIIAFLIGSYTGAILLR